MNKFCYLFSGILLLSFSVMGQTIIPQKSDSLKQGDSKKVEYYGDEKQEEEPQKSDTSDRPSETQESTPDIKEIPVVVKDTVMVDPTKIKYYQMVEVEQVPVVKEKKNKHQIKTLSGRMGHSGGYGAVTFKTTQFKDQTMVLAGLRGGWVINRTLAIGLDVYGVIPTAKYTDISEFPSQEFNLMGGYGGLFLELILFSNEVVHITFPVSSGAGWLGYGDVSDYNMENFVDDDVFWYIEPGANLELNVSRNFRMDFGVSKRFTQDLVLVNTEADAFDNINYYLTLKIGGF